MAEILVIGAAIIDVLVSPASEKVFCTGSYPADDIRMAPGADALNEAAVLAGLGDNVRLETVIGRDKAGEYILKYCKDKGIEMHKECIRQDIKTGINVVLISEKGERSFLTNRNGSLRSLKASDIHRPFSRDVKILCFASIFVFPHIGVRELEMLFHQAKTQGITVCADMTKCKNGETAEELMPAFRYIDYLFANAEEAILLTGEKTVKDACKRIRRTGAGCVIIKCGAKGCYLENENKSFWVPAVPGVRCIDTTGAGDSFTAGFIHSLLKRRSMEKCAEYANWCGARAVEVIGAAEWIDKDSFSI